MQTEEHNLVNIHGLGRALHLPVEWLKREADSGAIPCLRVGRRRIFNLVAVKAALAERAAGRKNPTAPPATTPRPTILGGAE